MAEDEDGIPRLSSRDMPRGPAAKTAMEAYWRSLRAAGRLPRRRDVDPSRFEGALPHAFVLERAAPGVARLRVAGQGLGALLGVDARGLPLSAFFTPADRPSLRAWLDRCFDGPALVDLPVAAKRAFRPALGGRLLLLPLLDVEGQVTRALGGIFLDGAVGRARVQLGLVEDATTRCEPVGRVVPVAVAQNDGGRRGLAEAPRAHLRLVVDNGRRG